MNKRLQAKIKENWHVTYIDYSGQGIDFHKRMLNHLKDNTNFLGESKEKYYFQFDSEAKIGAFLRIMEKSFNELKIKVK